MRLLAALALVRTLGFRGPQAPRSPRLPSAQAPRRAPRPPSRRCARPLSIELEEDEGSYEAKWRRRRIEDLKAAPELSTDELEDLFEPEYLRKRLYEQNPEMAFGAIFKLEGVVMDTDVAPTLVDAWGSVAEELDYPKPTAADIDYMMASNVRHEDAVDRVFGWTRDWSAAREAAARYGEVLHQLNATDFDADNATRSRAGVELWLRDLRRENVPCCAVSRLPRKLVDKSLALMNLTEYFSGVVCSEDSRDRANQAFLHGAICCERQPSRCVVFTDSVDDAISAHEAEMRVVGVMGAVPAYELNVADSVVPDLGDLRVQDMRKLFSDREFDPLPEVEVEVFLSTEVDVADEFDDLEEEPAPGGGGDDFWSRAGL